MGKKDLPGGAAFFACWSKADFQGGNFFTKLAKIPGLGIQREGASPASRSRVGQEVFGVQGRSLGECWCRQKEFLVDERNRSSDTLSALGVSGNIHQSVWLE